MADTHTIFEGAIPRTYDRFLGPLWFDPYAVELAARLPERPGLRVLELACGTGIATRRLRKRLPRHSILVATDLNAPMIALARSKFAPMESIRWLQADAVRLPFGDHRFDVVVCQFGLMFFPDRNAAIREIVRVLASEGLFLFNTWDSLEYNDLARLAHEVCAEAVQPDAAPQFWRVPYGMHDPEAIRALLAAGGFTDIRVEALARTSTGSSAEGVARGMIQGTPCLLELKARGVDPASVTKHATQRIAERYGDAPVRATMRAYLFTASR